jgi:hypothetical protein
MNTGIKIIAGIAIGGLIVFLYLKSKKTVPVTAPLAGPATVPVTPGAIGKTDSGVEIKITAPVITQQPVVPDPVLSSIPVPVRLTPADKVAMSSGAVTNSKGVTFMPDM